MVNWKKESYTVECKYTVPGIGVRNVKFGIQIGADWTNLRHFKISFSTFWLGSLKNHKVGQMCTKWDKSRTF